MPKAKSTARAQTRGTAKRSSAGVQVQGAATAADAQLAAGLAPTATNVEPDVTDALALMILDTDVIDALNRFSEVIDAHDAGKVEEMVPRVEAFLPYYEAYLRLLISVARLHEFLVRENKAIAPFLTAVSAVFKNAGKISAIRSNAPLKKLVDELNRQRGIRKRVTSRKKNARKKGAAGN